MKKFQSLVELYDFIPENERIMVDVLRQIVHETLPGYTREKLSWNVPYFSGNRGICIIWPASIPRGGFKEGVLLGFSHGNRLKDIDGYLEKGTNKRVYYKIYTSPEEIDSEAVIRILEEAIEVDGQK